MGRFQKNQMDGFRLRFRTPLGGPLSLYLGWWRINEMRPRLFYQHSEEPLAGWSIAQPDNVAVRDRLDARLTVMRIKNFNLSYDAAFSSPEFSVDNLNAPASMLTHGGRIKWTAPCNCMALETTVRFWPNQINPEVRFSLALSALGETVELF